MKKSNILILTYAFVMISFVSIIFGIYTRYDDNNMSNRTMKRFELKEFSTVMVMKGVDLHLSKGDSNRIEFEEFKDKLYQKPQYKLQGDTLYVYSGLKAFVSGTQFAKVIGNHHFWLEIKGEFVDTLHVKANNGRTILNLNGLNTENKKTGVLLNLEASDSANVEFSHESIIEYASILANNHVNINLNTLRKQSLKIRLQNKSDINMNSARKMDIEKDNSSFVRIYD